MNRIIYINPIDLEEIIAFSYIRNDGIFSKYIDPIDYYFILFSTLYQSGINYFQTNLNLIPPSIKQSDFWKNKLIQFDKDAFINSMNKTNSLTKDKFHFEDDSAKVNQLKKETISHFSNFFYSLETGVPFINTHYFFPKYLEIMNKRLDNVFLHSLQNLSSLIKQEEIQTLTPKYSILKQDLKRFEDIANSRLFFNYSESLSLLPETKKLKSIKKDIAFNSYRLFNKYSSSFTLKSTAFTFLQINKNIADLFFGKIPSIIGDFFIQSLEKIVSEKKRIYFFEIDEIKYHKMFCNILQDCINKHGTGILRTIYQELEDKQNSH